MVKQKMTFMLVIGVMVGMVAGIFLSETVWAFDAVKHPVLQNERQLPSRALFKEREGGTRRPGFYGRATALAKLNQIIFRENIQALTAPNAFRARLPVAPEAPNPNRAARTD